MMLLMYKVPRVWQHQGRAELLSCKQNDSGFGVWLAHIHGRGVDASNDIWDGGNECEHA